MASALRRSCLNSLRFREILLADVLEIRHAKTDVESDGATGVEYRNPTPVER